MRAELMLELSGLPRQKQLVVKACAAPTKSGSAITHLTFEAIADVLVEQYASVHLRWSFENTSQGTPKGTNPPFKRVEFMADEEWESWDGDQAYPYDDYEMEYEYIGFWAEEETHDETQNDLHGDYADDVTEYEAIALNTAAETEFDG